MGIFKKSKKTVVINEFAEAAISELKAAGIQNEKAFSHIRRSPKFIDELKKTYIQLHKANILNDRTISYADVAKWIFLDNQLVKEKNLPNETIDVNECLSILFEHDLFKQPSQKIFPRLTHLNEYEENEAQNLLCWAVLSNSLCVEIMLDTLSALQDKQILTSTNFKTVTNFFCSEGSLQRYAQLKEKLANENEIEITVLDQIFSPLAQKHKIIIGKDLRISKQKYTGNNSITFFNDKEVDSVKAETKDDKTFVVTSSYKPCTIL